MGNKGKRRFYFQKEEKVVINTNGWIEIDMEFTQFYRGLVHAFAKLNSPCAMKLLPFLFFEMNDSNAFTFDDLLIDRFSKMFSENSFHVRTIRSALRELVDAGIIHKVRNGRYWVDPKYCWTGDVGERLEMLKSQKLFLDAIKEESDGNDQGEEK